MARSSEFIGVTRGVKKMEYSVLPTSQLLLQFKRQPRSAGLREMSPFHAMTEARDTTVNESIRWKVTECGGRIELTVTDISGDDLSVMVTLSDVWEFFISFFGSTAAALAQSGLERGRVPKRNTTGTEIAGGKDAKGRSKRPDR